MLAEVDLRHRHRNTVGGRDAFSVIAFAAVDGDNLGFKPEQFAQLGFVVRDEHPELFDKASAALRELLDAVEGTPPPQSLTSII
ncbi:MAG: hypothetical protein AAFX52_10990 [Pseudomonadota bacterium]